jgi:hydroxymethylglutaryl-CoA lyase
MKLIPNCAQSFSNLIKSNYRYCDLFDMLNLKNVRVFDVTLRDGLQALNKDEQNKFSTFKKKQLYNLILQNNEPKNMEIGSLVNKKLLPIFDDTEELFDYAEVNNKYHKTLNHYLLVPNFDHLMDGIKIGCNNFSFITSVSNSFQLKNTKMTLEENYKNLNDMMIFLGDFSAFKTFNVKLYVSCISECPIEGQINCNDIIEKLIHLNNNLKPNKLCLSDTCGTLNPSDFHKIINGLRNNDIDISKISLHLHVQPEREKITENIFHIALDNGINEFDVSALNSGGCSITMDKNKIAPNMSYEHYYKFMTSYLIKNL